MFHINISDESDIAEAVRKLILEAISQHEAGAISDLEDTIDTLECDLCDLREVTNDRQDRIEYLESILKENDIEFK